MSGCIQQDKMINQGCVLVITEKQKKVSICSKGGWSRGTEYLVKNNGGSKTKVEVAHCWSFQMCVSKV